jgi:uncharacterized protein YeaO (DUF488 family)
VLVDRLWPRGISKVKLQLDLWEKAVAPSTELRKWFDHDPAKWSEFRKRYHAELRHAATRCAIDETIAAAGKKRVITLVYGAKDTEHNEAVMIQGVSSAGCDISVPLDNRDIALRASACLRAELYDKTLVCVEGIGNGLPAADIAVRHPPRRRHAPPLNWFKHAVWTTTGRVLI